MGKILNSWATIPDLFGNLCLLNPTGGSDAGGTWNIIWEAMIYKLITPNLDQHLSSCLQTKPPQLADTLNSPLLGQHLLLALSNLLTEPHAELISWISSLTSASSLSSPHTTHHRVLSMFPLNIPWSLFSSPSLSSLPEFRSPSALDWHVSSHAPSSSQHCWLQWHLEQNSLRF